MPEHRSHHKAEPEPTKKTVKDYAWIGVVVTALGTLLGGHAYDRNASIDQSARMHRSTLRHNAEKRAVLEFRVKLLERQVREIHGELHSSHPPAGLGGGVRPTSSAWPTRPEHHPAPRGPPGAQGMDAYDEIMQEVEAGGEYQPKGYGY